MNVRISWEFDRFDRRSRYLLRCDGVLNGSILGDDYSAALRSIDEINARRASLGLPLLVVSGR